MALRSFYSKFLGHKGDEVLDGGNVQLLGAHSEEERVGQVNPLCQHASQQIHLLGCLS
jgi:hypothetical protein